MSSRPPQCRWMFPRRKDWDIPTRSGLQRFILFGAAIAGRQNEDEYLSDAETADESEDQPPALEPSGGWELQAVCLYIQAMVDQQE